MKCPDKQLAVSTPKAVSLSCIWRAALLVKVIAKMFSLDFKEGIKWAMRWVRVCVLPVPGLR